MLLIACTTEQECDLRWKIVTGEWPVRECDRLSNEVIENCDRKKLRILKIKMVCLRQMGSRLKSQSQSMKLI